MSETEAARHMSLLALATRSEEIAPALRIDLPGALFTSNLGDTNPRFAMHMASGVYAPRTAKLDAIALVGLPKATIYGGGHFVTACAGTFVTEQVPPYVGKVIPSVSEVAAVSRPTMLVGREKLLIARYGLSTWGHWLGELLPKIILAETLYPGRFSFVLPTYAINGSRPKSIWSSIAQCLAAYNIPADRVYPIDDTYNYEFSSLFAITPVWSDHIIHPAASDALRRGVEHIPPGKHARLAVLRDVRFDRKIANADDVYGALESHGFACQSTGRLSFAEQVSAFKGASAVFGVLGSDLTNLLFSPSGVDVITAAPDIFGDRFFYALTLDRHGRMADLRGPVLEPHPSVEHKGTFTLEPKVLTNALEKMLGDAPGLALAAADKSRQDALPAGETSFASTSSLGSYCETAFQLLRGNRNVIRGPLDWMFAHYFSVEKAVTLEFEDFFNFDRLEINADKTRVIENVFGIILFPTFSRLPNGLIDESKIKPDFDRQVAKYAHLVGEFRRTLLAPGPHLYVVRWNRWFLDHQPARDCAVLLMRLLRSKHVNGSCSLLVVQDEAAREAPWEIEGVFNRYVPDVSSQRWQGDDAAWDVIFEEFAIAKKRSHSDARIPEWPNQLSPR
jgi:hypothetical protein